MQIQLNKKECVKIFKKNLFHQFKILFKIKSNNELIIL